METVATNQKVKVFQVKENHEISRVKLSYFKDKPKHFNKVDMFHIEGLEVNQTYKVKDSIMDISVKRVI
jgi:hypothetical protein